MPPTRRAARNAGLLCLLMGLPGAFSYLYVSAKLIVPGNASATAGRILASEMLFRSGIVAELLSGVGAILAVGALYRLFRDVDKGQAWLMSTFLTLSIPIGFLNVVNDLAALTLLRGADFLKVFDQGQLQALAFLFLNLHGNGLIVSEIFWGLWLLPYGLLVMRSGFAPRILGALLLVNGFAYLAASVTALLLPEYSRLVHRWAMIPETGELWILLWLLFKGPSAPPSSAP